MTTVTYILVSIAFISICVAQNDVSKVVTIVQGPVRGYKANGSDVFEFFGIPYATAPIGTDKFKAPLEAPTWSQTLEAVESTIVCPQYPAFVGGLRIQEDCLVANVFVPDTQETNLPVLVIIHGGAFLLGFGHSSSPKPLVESKRIIAVTFNYRLGANGFLCLGTEDVPGNAGLKDMLALLRWVKSNIADFGGNPDDVTLAGYSAGAAAADLLMLSKSAEGLFNKVIPESAAHVGTWSVQIDPIKVAQDYAHKLNFHDVDNLAALEEFYKTSSNELLHSDMTLFANTYSDFDFAPCLEKDVGQEIILTESPVNIIERGDYKKIPVLYGFANMEGMFRMPYFDTWARQMNENFVDFLPRDVQFEDSSEKERVSQKVKEFYFGDQNVGLYTLFDYINFFSDVLFAYPILRSVKLQVEAGSDSIYLYEYTFYRKFLPVEGVPSVLVNFPGANHCAQTEAVLESLAENTIEENFTDEYKLIRAQIRELWLNFIVTGNPVPEGSTFPTWPPTNASRTPYMILGETIELGDNLNEQRAQFWDDIYDQYYRHPEQPKELPNSAVINSLPLKSILLCLMLVYIREAVNWV